MGAGLDSHSSLVTQLLTIDVERGVVHHDGIETGPDPMSHRETVVRRLLERGIQQSTLVALLPDWRELIISVETRGDGSTGSG